MRNQFIERFKEVVGFDIQDAIMSENFIHMTREEAILCFMSVHYDEDNFGDIYVFLTQNLEISEEFLLRLGCNNNSFFEHMNSYEALVSIVKSAVYMCSDIPYYDNLDFWFDTKNEAILDYDTHVQSKLDGTLLYVSSNRSFPSNFMSSLHNKLKDSNIDYSNSTFYYHGTSWVGAQSISEFISLDETGHGDFGKGTFYVSEYWPTALKWAMNRNAHAPAVCVFIVPNDWLNGDGRCLNFTGATNDWKELVTKCRKRPPVNRLVQLFRQELHNNRYIRGPISRDGDETPPEALLAPNNTVQYQVAVKTNDLAQLLRLNLKCVFLCPVA